MPIEIRDTDDGLGTLIMGTGVMTGDEYLKAFQRQLTQPSEKRMKYLYSLSDFTGVTKVDVSTRAIKSFAKMCKSASAVTPGTVIAVAAGKDIEYGFLGLWKILSDETEWEIRVLRSIEKAKGWIAERLKEKWDLTNLTFDALDAVRRR